MSLDHRRRRWRLRLTRPDGQVFIEYALVLALMGVVAIGALEALGVDVSGLLQDSGSQFASVTNP